MYRPSCSQSFFCWLDNFWIWGPTLLYRQLFRWLCVCLLWVDILQNVSCSHLPTMFAAFRPPDNAWAALLTGSSRRECDPPSLPKSVSHRVHGSTTWSGDTRHMECELVERLCLLICFRHPPDVFSTEWTQCHRVLVSPDTCWSSSCLSTEWWNCHMGCMCTIETLNIHVTIGHNRSTIGPQQQISANSSVLVERAFPQPQ